MKLCDKKSQLYFLGILLAALAMLSSTIFGTFKDLEEYLSTILSTSLSAKAYIEMRLPLWTDTLGLGAPLSFSQGFTYHPLTLLFALIDLQSALIFLYAFQFVIATFSLWYLCAHLGLEKLIRFVIITTYIFSSPTQNYLLTDFWPSLFMNWTMAPLILLAIISLQDARTYRENLIWICILSLSFGLMILNGHVGHNIVYLSIFIIFLLVDFKKTWKKLWSLFIAALIAGMIIFSKLIITVEEIRQFSENLERINWGSSLLDPKIVWGLFLKPFALGSISEIIDINITTGTRIIAFGIPFALITFLSPFLFFQIEKNYRPFIITTIFCIIGTCLPRDTFLKIISWTFLYRDPLILFGSISAGIFLSQIVLKKNKTVFILLCIFQVLTVCVGALPFITQGVVKALYEEKEDVGFNNMNRVPELVLKLRSRGSGRVYLSKKLYEQIEQKRVVKDGIFVNTLAFYDVRVINGIFKGFSMASLYPDLSIPYGQIKGQESVPMNKDLLDILSVKYVVSIKEETVHPKLVGVDRWIDKSGTEFFLWENLDAGSEAFFLDTSTAAIELKSVTNCEFNVGLLCSDVSELKKIILKNQKIDVDSRNGKLFLKYEVSSKKRYILLSTMYREGWRGPKDANLIQSKFGLIELMAPEGSSELMIEYAPPLRGYSIILSWLTILTTSIIALIIYLKYKFSICKLRSL
jgi:hypothetical protein